MNKPNEIVIQITNINDDGTVIGMVATTYEVEKIRALYNKSLLKVGVFTFLPNQSENFVLDLSKERAKDLLEILTIGWDTTADIDEDMIKSIINDLTKYLNG